jgi:hypothetical protein
MFRCNIQIDQKRPKVDVETIQTWTPGRVGKRDIEDVGVNSVIAGKAFLNRDYGVEIGRREVGSWSCVLLRTCACIPPFMFFKYSRNSTDMDMYICAF